jgi:hypothetical protein
MCHSHSTFVFLFVCIVRYKENNHTKIHNQALWAREERSTIESIETKEESLLSSLQAN